MAKQWTMPMPAGNRALNQLAIVLGDRVPIRESFTIRYTDNLTSPLRGIGNTVVQAGYSIVVDATFLRIFQRAPFLQLAQTLHCSYVILDVWVLQEVLKQRIEHRTQVGTDASDATLEVLQQQKERQDPFTKR